MSSFNLGDRVVFVKNTDYGGRIGEKGEIVEIDNTDIPYRVVYDSLAEGNRYAWATEDCIVDDTQPVLAATGAAKAADDLNEVSQLHRIEDKLDTLVGDVNEMKKRMNGLQTQAANTETACRNPNGSGLKQMAVSAVMYPIKAVVGRVALAAALFFAIGGTTYLSGWNPAEVSKSVVSYSMETNELMVNEGDSAVKYILTDSGWVDANFNRVDSEFLERVGNKIRTGKFGPDSVWPEEKTFWFFNWTE